jgi:hydroxymethylbilane synthase
MRVGTRGSALALAQTRLIAELLGGAEIVTITTTGDRESQASTGTEAGTNAATDTSAATDWNGGAGGRATDKSRWVMELEDALLAGEIDLAVHSAKDVPGELAEGLSLLGAPARASAEDVLCGVGDLDDLPQGARVGTSSLRRAAQLLAVREDLRVEAIRGNVDTRLRKLGEGSHDAIVLARAGLERLGRASEIGAVLDPARFVPSPGQGVLALEARSDDERVKAAVQTIVDNDASACLLAERAVARELGAGCHTPFGAHAVAVGCGCLELHAWVGLPDGSRWLSDGLVGGFYDPEELGGRMAERLKSVGALELLREAERMVLS